MLEVEVEVETEPVWFNWLKSASELPRRITSLDVHRGWGVDDTKLISYHLLSIGSLWKWYSICKGNLLKKPHKWRISFGYITPPPPPPPPNWIPLVRLGEAFPGLDVWEGRGYWAFRRIREISRRWEGGMGEYRGLVESSSRRKRKRGKTVKAHHILLSFPWAVSAGWAHFTPHLTLEGPPARLTPISARPDASAGGALSSSPR